jgi:hypothetical protein
MDGKPQALEVGGDAACQGFFLLGVLGGLGLQIGAQRRRKAAGKALPVGLVLSGQCFEKLVIGDPGVGGWLRFGRWQRSLCA